MQAPLARAPGPAGGFLMGCAEEFRSDTLAFLSRSAQEFGDVFRFRLGPHTIHLVGSPEGARAVFQDRPHVYQRQSPGYRALRLSLGDGLLTADGAPWLAQRRLIQPAFAPERLGLLPPIVQACTERMLARWRSASGPVDVAAELSVLTLDILGRALFGLDLTADAPVISQALTALLRFTIGRARKLLPLPIAWPLPAHRAYRAELARLDAVVFRMIQDRRAGEVSGDDVLGTLVRATDDETGRRMTDRQLRDEVLTLLLAGHETTAVSLAWTMYLLAQHPDARERVSAEADGALDGELPYTHAVFDEALRVYPPAWGIARLAMQEDAIAGFAIPARTMVMVSPYLLHRHPAHWARPDAFDPERFLPGGPRREPSHRWAYCPFGGGTHLCVGRSFALIEARLVLALIARHFRWELADATPVEAEPLITLRPKRGIRVLLTARSGR